jgi:DNA-binding LacI/PurR family transcriptional regulator
MIAARGRCHLVTLRDVAKAAGVSISTASRVLNNTAEDVGIAEDTKQKVWQKAKELNYRPNKMARNLKLGRRPEAILFLFCGSLEAEGGGFLTHPFFSHMLHGIHMAVGRMGRYLVFMNEDQRNHRQLKRLLEETVCGVITWGQLNAKTVESLDRIGMPMVCIAPYKGGLKAPSVYVDSEGAVRQALQYLYGLGHRRICFVGPGNPNGAMQERLESFRKMARELGILGQTTIQLCQEAGPMSDVEAGFHAALKVLFGTDLRPTAILTPSDLLAIGVMKAARHTGLEIPKDLSVVGIDNIDRAADTNPALTTVDIPKERMGMQAATLLEGLLEGEEVGSVKTMIPTRLIIRDSAAPI